MSRAMRWDKADVQTAKGRVATERRLAGADTSHFTGPWCRRCHKPFTNPREATRVKGGGYAHREACP